jgi:hypothetical protein
VAEAATLLGNPEKGMGFSLPDDAEIAALSRKAASLLGALPRAPMSRFQSWAIKHLVLLDRVTRGLAQYSAVVRVPGQRRAARALAGLAAAFRGRADRIVKETQGEEYRRTLAKAFGAPVRLVARKRGTAGKRASGRLAGSFSEEDGVVLGFDAATLSLLQQGNGMFPDIQLADAAAIERVFPPSVWARETDSRGLRTMVSSAAVAAMHASRPEGKIMLVLRTFAIGGARAYRVGLFQGERELCGHDIHQSESFLLSSCATPYADDTGDRFSIRVAPIEPCDLVECRPRFAISHAGAFAVPDPSETLRL